MRDGGGRRRSSEDESQEGGGGEGGRKSKKSEKTLKILVGSVVPGEYSRQAAGSLLGEMTLGMLTGT